MQPKPSTEQPHHFSQPVADLCATCVHLDNCHLRQMPTKPVHSCNEYDDGTPAITPDPSVLISVPQAPVQSQAPNQATHLGLCVNCDHRETCTLPHPAGGVWHCEEYQ
jgi:hypothetical protein